MTITNDPNQRELQSAVYTLSRARIAEQVIINVLSALALGALAAVASLLLLLYQHVVQAIIVPTNVLLAIVFFGLGALVMLVLIAIGAYVSLRIAIHRSNAVTLGLLFGLIGYAAGSGALKDLITKAGGGAATKGEKQRTETPSGTPG